LTYEETPEIITDAQDIKEEPKGENKASPTQNDGKKRSGSCLKTVELLF